MASQFNRGAQTVLKVLIVDDEPLAHDVLLHHIANHDELSVKGQCYNAIEALQWLANNSVDVIFLDINMPQLSGIEMLKVMGNRPQVVIVSAYQDYALEGFELEVCDYLLKPVSGERFAKAVQKLLRQSQNQVEVSATANIVLKVDREMHKFNLDEIDFFESYGNYVKVWQKNQCVLVSSTLKRIHEALPLSGFTQIHKSFVVNNAKVKSVGTEAVSLESGQHIKIGKTYKNDAAKIL